MPSALEQHMENTAHAWLAERDRPRGQPCTIWRSIVMQGALAIAREHGWTPPPPPSADPAPRRQPAVDFKRAAANDFDHDDLNAGGTEP